jgi:heme/copper-type cytochrome/quinol oxidase subunit 1
MIQFIVVSSFLSQDYISFIFSLVFSFVVFSFGVVVFLLLQSTSINIWNLFHNLRTLLPLHFGLLFLLMFTIGGSTGIILGNAAVDLGLHDTYYVGLEQEKTPRKCPHPTKIGSLVIFHLVSTFIGILLTFSPMHFLGFNVMPRRIPDFPDSFHSWNFLSSIGSGITFLSFAIFFHLIIIWSLFSCFWRGERLSKC